MSLKRLNEEKKAQALLTTSASNPPCLRLFRSLFLYLSWSRLSLSLLSLCSSLSLSFEFHFFSDRPKKIFYGKECCSLAVTIGAGMNLHPILLQHAPASTRRKYKLGLLSLTKSDLSLVMEFLEQVEWQAVLPSSDPPFFRLLHDA
jgi:hypothetical protein